MSFVRAANPIWFMVDLVGLALNDQYYAFFLTNTLPYIPQNVYRDPQGMTVWTGDIVQFYPNGTLPDNLYFDPTLVYRIEIRKGNTQSAPLIYEINNFVPGSGNAITVPPFFGATNQISNPQFQFINFISPLTITTAGTYPIAPDWNLILTGAGTTVLTQEILAGTDNQINNPPFALRINNSGWSSAQLVQQFSNNGALWADGAVSMSLTGGVVSGSPQTVSLIYMPSFPGVAKVVATGTLNTGAYQIIQGAINLPASVNTGTNDTAYTQMVIQLPPGGIIDVSNIQVVGQDSPIDDSFPIANIPSYQQQTSERELDHLFNYYKQPLSFKPIPSYLVGWDFALNPTQWGANFGPNSGANTSFYVWDQTILFQSTTSGLTVTPNTYGEIEITASVNSQAALIQYLPADQIASLLSGPISVNLNGFFASPGPPATIQTTISLYYTTGTLPSIAAGNSIVATLNADGSIATFNNGSQPWVKINPLNNQNATFILNSGDYAFNGYWNTNGLPGAITYLAIVIGTATITANYALVLNSVSFQSGSIATHPAPQTLDEVLRQCQFYYEQSYLPGVAPGTSATTTGAITSLQNVYVNGGTIAGKAGFFYLDFKTVKQNTPTFTFYSPSTGNSGFLDIVLYNGNTSAATPTSVGATNWTASIPLNIYNYSLGPNGFTTLITATASASAPQCINSYQYTADSRLGR